ncbi:nuclear transport factor 2 family protein [Neisseria sp.]|uniref:YybH family protein n=1 Tax=Neisseria sp. TaxID=192066 RepID=UPI00359FF9A1
MTMQEDDRTILLGMVEEMTRAKNANELMRHWAQDVLHFDTAARCLEGSGAARAEIAAQFAQISNSGATIQSSRCFIGGGVGVVAGIQNVWVQCADGGRQEMTVRQTDCFEKRNGQWQLVHEHISLPVGDAAALLGGEAS